LYRSLPPVEFVGQRCDAFDQRAGLGCRQSRQAPKRGDDRKRSFDHRPRDQFLRPIAQERLSLGAEASNSRKACTRGRKD
jgi:hypothetical protein